MLVRRDSDQYILQLSKLPNEELVGAGTGWESATSADLFGLYTAAGFRSSVCEQFMMPV
jgi:hypothetical protein